MPEPQSTSLAPTCMPKARHSMPLNGVPIPPIDNFHIMHYAATATAPEYFTVHMYFVPEEVDLGWEVEPPAL